MYEAIKEQINDLEFVKGRNNISKHGRILLDELKDILSIVEQKEDFADVVSSFEPTCEGCKYHNAGNGICDECSRSVNDNDYYEKDQH